MIETLTHCLLAIILVLSAAIDAKKSRIPNVLTMPAILSAVLIHSFDKGLYGFYFSTGGLIIGFGLLVIFYLAGGMGAGDVKLMGAVGSFIGPKAIVEAFILIALAGGVYSLALILIRRDVFRGFFCEKLMILSNMAIQRQYMPFQSENSGQKPHLRYGVAIAFGTITYLVLKSFGIKIIA